jgi:predicted enzyme related to lactoylglutathione lyase
MSRHPPQPVVHLELHTGDLSGARAFYGGLCGWRPESVDTGHGTYETVAMDGPGGPVSGGFVECSAPKALWLPYIEVERVDRATAKAEELGARVLLAPREGPAGWRSVVSSPAAGELAFWQPKR